MEESADKVKKQNFKNNKEINKEFKKLRVWVLKHLLSDHFQTHTVDEVEGMDRATLEKEVKSAMGKKVT